MSDRLLNGKYYDRLIDILRYFFSTIHTLFLIIHRIYFFSQYKAQKLVTTNSLKNFIELEIEIV